MDTSGTSAPDPGLGVFDTLLVQDHRPFELAAHVERLAHSAYALYDSRLDEQELAARVRMAAQDGPALQRLRLTVAPGEPVRIALVALAERPRGMWDLAVSPFPGGFGAHKWVDRTRLDALSDDPSSSTSDPLLVDESGLVLETARGHLFLVGDGVVHTPPLDGRILPGVVRRRAIATLLDLGVPCHESPVALDDLAAADEVFVTNSIGGVRGVSSVRGVGRWGEGPFTRLVASTVESIWESVD